MKMKTTLKTSEDESRIRDYKHLDFLDGLRKEFPNFFFTRNECKRSEGMDLVNQEQQIYARICAFQGVKKTTLETSGTNKTTLETSEKEKTTLETSEGNETTLETSETEKTTLETSEDSGTTLNTSEGSARTCSELIN